MMRQVVVVLPDIRSTYNVGSFFRTADAAGVKKIVLSGITAQPPHPHLIKVSLGAEKSVPWEHVADTSTALRQLRDQGYQIVIVEGADNSQDFRQASYADKVALVFGSETAGVSSEFIQQADAVVSIPMLGHKESLNVSVAGGIIMYQVLHP
ncbi:MAG: RNA methyltransferase [Patescibacteria group bacterium]